MYIYKIYAYTLYEVYNKIKQKLFQKIRILSF